MARCDKCKEDPCECATPQVQKLPARAGWLPVKWNVCAWKFGERTCNMVASAGEFTAQLPDTCRYHRDWARFVRTMSEEQYFEEWITAFQPDGLYYEPDSIWSQEPDHVWAILHGQAQPTGRRRPILAGGTQYAPPDYFVTRAITRFSEELHSFRYILSQEYEWANYEGRTDEYDEQRYRAFIARLEAIEREHKAPWRDERQVVKRHRLITDFSSVGCRGLCGDCRELTQIVVVWCGCEFCPPCARAHLRHCPICPEKAREPVKPVK